MKSYVKCWSNISISLKNDQTTFFKLIDKLHQQYIYIYIYIYKYKYTHAYLVEEIFQLKHIDRSPLNHLKN